jgi:mono/diheme cytochrome c family protein
VLTRYRKISILALLLVALSLLAAACSTDKPTGDCLIAENGAFANAPCDVPEGQTAEPTPTPTVKKSGTVNPGFIAFRASGCSGCHAIDGTSASGQIGPNLTGIATRGGVEYIHESIVDPGAVIAANCPSGPCMDGLMPQNYGEVLSAADIDAIVGYLAGL